ncbi:pickpocket protein 28-like [Uranotaenia lowii]|uniref:pickpocket protein 28-like n=1 Tax=Uranotaenia lowii TaxID=190385 RepID=UPI00247941E1|nr:pickpocket protein 28-like [Uranotaenia lowii]
MNGYSQKDMFKPSVLHNDYIYLNETKALANWTYKTGYTPGAKKDTYPIRAIGSGAKAGMTLDLSTFYKYAEVHCRSSQGFKLILHPPFVYPRVAKNFILISPKRDMTVSIRPRIITTSPKLKSFSPVIRHCYFSDERSLMFFNEYEQSNCELECLTNYTLKMCGCVRFSMPRTAKMRVCGMHEKQCMERAGQQQFEESIDEAADDSKSCNCMPACASIDYDTENTLTTNEYGITVTKRKSVMKPEEVNEIIK